MVNVFQKEEDFSKNDYELRQDLISNQNGIIIPVLPKFTLKINTSMEFTVSSYIEYVYAFFSSL